MRPEIQQAIARDEQVLTEDEARSIADELRSRCGVNLSFSADPNYATSYELVITDRDVPTPAERTASGAGRTQLPGTHYVLSLRLSWLGPFAMAWWGRYEQGKDPVAVPGPERDREREIEACFTGLLRERGIELLGEDELREPVEGTDVLTLDGEQPTVASLLFALFV